MKIGLLCWTPNISEGEGNNVRAKKVFKELKKRYDVTLISIGKDKNHNLGNTILLAPQWRKLWNLWLCIILLRTRFNCIYCSADWRGFFTAYLFSKVFRYKIIFEAHSITSETTKYLFGKNKKFKLARIVEKFVISHADRVITLSPNTFDFYKKYNENIELVPNYVEEDLFIQSDNAKRKHRDTTEQLRHIGLIGPFGVGANIGFIEFIVDHQSEFDPGIRFVAIGKCESELECERIEYTGYLDSVQDYIKQLTAMDAILVPSAIATTGPCNKILEAMSCSIPVFTTPEGMIGLFFIENGKDIFVFDKNMLVEGINSLIFNDTLLAQVGDNARTAVERYYSKRVNEPKLTQVLEKV